ncbi:MAG: hypothetical protein OHK0053_14310 [Microscillaceae bacterium]
MTACKKLVLLFLLGIAWGTFPVSAQLKLPFLKKLEAEIYDTQVMPEDTSILVKYHLSGYKRRYYEVKLYYSNNGGNSYKGPLRLLDGDFGDSTRTGRDKQIRWDFYRENPYFDGKRIMFKIQATEMPKIANGGPENAFRSLLVPGLGDTKVRNGYNYGWITALSYGCLGTGALFQLRASNKYDDYQARIANTESEHRDLFQQAERSQNWATGFFIAGGAIWAADIVGVYLRGLKNRRRLAQEAAEKAKAEEEAGTRGWPIILPLTPTGHGGATLIWRF